MWHGRKQTLPSNRRASTLLKKPTVKSPSLYKRFSLRNPEHFEDEILHSGLGLHPDFMIPTTPRGLGGKMVKLDALRLLNMGHINERYHQDYFHPPKRSSVLQELELEARCEEPIFPVRQILKVARNSLQPVKIKLDRTPDPMRRSASAIVSKSEFDSSAIKGGFFTVEQGIGTGRVNSPTYQVTRPLSCLLCILKPWLCKIQ